MTTLETVEITNSGVEKGSGFPVLELLLFSPLSESCISEQALIAAKDAVNPAKETERLPNIGASLPAHVILNGLKMAVCVSASTVGKVTAPTAVVANSSLEAREACRLVESKDIMWCALNRIRLLLPRILICVQFGSQAHRFC